MALWYRVGSNRLRPVTLLLCARLSVIPSTSPSPLAVNSSKKTPPVYAVPNLPFIQFRSFAAPVQAKSKTKPSESASAGPRVNEAITAPVIRLVAEDGHNVISLREALDRARRLDLDLVEVQRDAKPPVCKIMDFHKEKYKKEVMEKERSKTKSALSLKSGEKKEVRFKAKTELKDLKVKADGITRLIERGYRVKCTALPTSGTQEENLGEHLSRLLALIEDVSFVESGPHVDLKHAYAIVRHIKFETKKSGKKKVADNPKASPSPKSAEKPEENRDEEPDEEWECDSESDDVNLTNLKNGEISKKPVTGFERLNRFDHKPAPGSVKEEPPKAMMNRYAVQTEPQKITTSNQSTAPYRDYNSRGNPLNQGRFSPSNSSEFNSRDAFNKGRVAPSNTRDPNYRDGFNQERIGMNSSQVNNSRYALNQDRIARNNFRDSNGRDAYNQNRGQFHNKEMPFQPSSENFRPSNVGQFRNEGPPPVNDHSNHPNTPPRPKFGIFNTSTKSTESSENTGSSDSKSPMSKFGIFGANRTNAPNNQR